MFRRKPASVWLTLVVTALIVPVASAQSVQPLGSAGREAAAFPKPDRPVASIISPIWASEDERRSVNETKRVFELMKIQPGMSVADIGAGSGFYTVQLSKVVGPNGVVYAQDVMPNYLLELTRRIGREKLGNVKVGQGEGHDPRLLPRSIDAALLIHMYHEIDQPYAFLFNLASSLKPKAIVGIVDLDRPTLQHGTPPALLRCELESVGYRQTGFHTLVGEVGYLAIFQAPELAIDPGRIKRCSPN